MTSLAGPKPLKSFLFSLLLWFVIVGCAVLLFYVSARAMPVGLEGWSYFIRLPWFAVLVVPLLWSICSAFRGPAAVLIGVGLGLAGPIVAGWLYAACIDPNIASWGLPWGGMDVWVQGLLIAVPSSVAGGCIGYFLNRQKSARE
jgi:hypothetical protein